MLGEEMPALLRADSIDEEVRRANGGTDSDERQNAEQRNRQQATGDGGQDKPAINLEFFGGFLAGLFQVTSFQWCERFSYTPAPAAAEPPTSL